MFVKAVLFICFCGVLIPAFSQDIFEASRSGNTKRIAELAKINPDTVNAINDRGFNPLMIACYRGQEKAAKFLVKKGAAINTNSPEGSALQAACYQNSTKLAVFLVKNGADLSKKGPDGNNALMYAVLNQNEKLVRTFVKAGADLNARNNDNQTAHSLAMTLDNQEIRNLTEPEGK